MDHDPANDPPATLTPELTQSVLRICEGPEEEREAALERLCHEHPHAADGIQSFLVMMRDVQSVFHGMPKPEDAAPPEQIGPYRILETLGEGGMGTVYLAEQQEPIQRRVALKVIKLGMDSRRVLARFERERQALALMSHDNIARVHDAGLTERGQPYFVMEHVEGLPLTRHCDNRRLDTQERLRMFVAVCDGVQHAHQKGVIHRDLKPGNIIVHAEGERAVPKIIDFGLARAIDEREIGPTLQTLHGQVMGTPGYMSPEQAATDAVDIDTRTDIYSLGVILYELLVGSLPLDPSTWGTTDLTELRKRLAETEPPRPSSRMESQDASSRKAAELRRTTTAGLARTLRADLDWVVVKALEHDRERRYPAVAELQADIVRFLNHEPVSAGPPSVGYRLRKFARRYRGLLTAAGVIAITLLGATVFSLLMFLDARDARDQSEADRVTAQQNLDNFNRLAGMVRLRKAREGERDLYPAVPDKIPAMQLWLDEHGRPLREMLPDLRATLARLEAKASPSEAEEFLAGALGSLIAELQAFAEADDGEVKRLERRLQWAAAVQQKTIDAHAERWAETITAIAASDRYGGLKLKPQLGLVPLGENPDTGLFEFYHLRSGASEELPARDAEGKLPIGDDTGIVFVLLPGGTFLMGAQSGDPEAANYDRYLGRATIRLHEVTLAPFFLSAYELTQGQWQRLSHRPNPSIYRAGLETPDGSVITPSHPVDQATWTSFQELFSGHALTLPTEAQWEYGCRAGTVTPWSCGTEPKDLQGHANCADKYASARVSAWPCDRSIDDGYVMHAPVGTFLPNGFGLCDMHGNMFELCLDDYGDYSHPVMPGTGLRQVSGEAVKGKVMRGGAFTSPPSDLRSAHRDLMPLAGRYVFLGARPARPVQE